MQSSTVAVFCIAALALLLFLSGLYVSATRARFRILCAGVDDPAHALTKAVRAHGNTAEYAAMLALLIYLLGQRSSAEWVSLGDGGRDRVALSVGDGRVGFCHAGASQPFPCRGGRWGPMLAVPYSHWRCFLPRHRCGAQRSWAVVFREGHHAPAMKEVVPGAREPCLSAHARLKLLETLPASHCAPCCEPNARGDWPITDWHVNLANPLHPPPNGHKKSALARR